MADISQLTRSGIISSEIRWQKLKNPDGTLTPFCYFSVDSEIDGAVETLKVLMQGQLCEDFAEMCPSTGDRILVRQTTPYIKDGELCTRLLTKDQVRITSAGGLASDISRLSQSGAMGEIHMNKLRGKDGTLTPFCYFDVTSEIDGPSETLRVLLQGGLCESFLKLNPAAGDHILLLHAVPYIKDGQLCTRLYAGDQIQLMPEKAREGMFGLPAEAFVSARFLFGGE